MDADGEGGYRVFLLARDFPEGALELRAVLTGTDDLQSSQTIIVNNVSNPSSTASVGEDGAVLGADDGSVVIVPSGVARGESLSVATLSQSEFEDLTGVDLDALGIGFLGAQALSGSRPLDGPVSTSATGFEDAVFDGGLLAQFTVYPDLDEDGSPELVVLNDATLAPDGTVLSDPRPIAALGENATTTTGALVPKQVFGPIEVRQGEAMTVDVYGFNPFSVVDPTAEWTSDGVTTTTTASVSSNLQAAGQLFTAVCPLDQPTGSGTVVLEQQTYSGILRNRVEVDVEILPRSSGGAGAPGEEAEGFTDDMADAIADIPVPGPQQGASESFQDALEELRDEVVESHEEASERIEEIQEDPTPEQEVALENTDASLEYPGDPPRWDVSDSECVTREEFDQLSRIADYESAVAAQLEAAGESALAAQYDAAAFALGTFLDGIVLDGVGLCGEDGDPPLPDEVETPALPKPDIPASPDTEGQTTGIPAGCIIRPPGGEGAASPALPDGSVASAALRPKGLPEPPGDLLGRITVRIDSEGEDNPVRSISDSNGYIYFAFIPGGAPFVATAFDRVTRESRTFEGVGPAFGRSTYLFFDFRAEQTNEVCTPPVGYDKTWRGFVSNDWFEADNWEPAGIPTSGDNVFICADAPGQPTHAGGSADANDLLVPEGASIDMASALSVLRVNGDLVADGPIDGAGGVVIMQGGSIEGTVHRVQVFEPTALSGATTITQLIEVVEPQQGGDGDASLDLNGNSLDTVQFECCVNGATDLIMNNPNDRLTVSGQADFTGVGDLAAGEIEFGGDVRLCGLSGADIPFSATGTKVTFAGSNPQDLIGNVGCPAGAGDGARFQELEIASPASVTVTTRVRVGGDLVIAQGASASFISNQATSISGDLDLNGSLTVALSAFTFNVAGILELQATGVLDNNGTMTVGSCDPNDGTINGVDPCP